jgi:hypothetical protein
MHGGGDVRLLRNVGRAFRGDWRAPPPSSAG